jgi:hypothetical protein
MADGRARRNPLRRVVRVRLIARIPFRIHRRPNPFFMGRGGKWRQHELATYKYRHYWVEIDASCGHILQRFWIHNPETEAEHPLGRRQRGGKIIYCEKCAEEAYSERLQEAPRSPAQRAE